MRSYQVFSRMTPAQAASMMAALEEKAPAVYTQAVAAASAAMKVRPKFLMRQSREKRADMVRRALATVRANPLADEVLASFFLEVRKELLTEWLDLLGLEHEEGMLKADNPPAPQKETLDKALQRFRAGEGSDERELLLAAFAAQSAIDWPDLEASLGGS